MCVFVREREREKEKERERERKPILIRDMGPCKDNDNNVTESCCYFKEQFYLLSLLRPYLAGA